jgi:hypothetical protein
MVKFRDIIITGSPENVRLRMGECSLISNLITAQGK